MNAREHLCSPSRRWHRNIDHFIICIYEQNDGIPFTKSGEFFVKELPYFKRFLRPIGRSNGNVIGPERAGNGSVYLLMGALDGRHGVCESIGLFAGLLTGQSYIRNLIRLIDQEHSGHADGYRGNFAACL